MRPTLPRVAAPGPRVDPGPHAPSATLTQRVAAFTSSPAADRLLALALLLLVLPATPAVSTPDADFVPPPLELGGHWRDDWWAWLLQIGLIAPIAWRRRAPLAVFLATAGVAFVQWLAGPELYGDLALLVGLYTVTAYEPRGRIVALAVGIAALGLCMAVWRWGGGSWASAIALGAMITVPVAFGLLTRARRRVLESARETAIRAERTRIARDLHDVVTHNLAVMVALADGARLTMVRDPVEARTAVDHIARTGREGLTEMRRLLGVLRDDDDPAPLRPRPGMAELSVLAGTVRAAGLDVRLDTTDAPPLPDGPAVTVHRIVQEALTNVLRHAPRAVRVEVRVYADDDLVRVEIHDDGGVTAVPEGPGAGLNGMRERVRLHGGELSAGPHGSGWRVAASLPLVAGSERRP